MKRDMKPTAFVFDIDNTLIRVPGFAGKTWEEYAINTHDADPIERIVDLAHTCILQSIAIVVVTYRSDSIREATENLLSKLGIEYDSLVMRKSGLKISSSDYKISAISKLTHEYSILQIFDDDKRVIEALESSGFSCTHVTDSVDDA